MEASKKVWIRGDASRKEEVIKMLTDLGAVNLYNNDGNNKDAIYFINHNNEIDKRKLKIVKLTNNFIFLVGFKLYLYSKLTILQP